VRSLSLSLADGYLGFMSPFTWMFISSYEKLRERLISDATITTLVQLEYSGFDGATVPICTFALQNKYRKEYRGGYVRLSDFRGSENQGPKTLEAVAKPNCGWFYCASADDFKKIPGSPISYWISPKAILAYEGGDIIGKTCYGQPGLQTSNNGRFVRLWPEVSQTTIELNCKSSEHSQELDARWFPYLKGGGFRKWYGNHEHVVDWQNQGARIKRYVTEKYPYLNGNIDYVIKDRGYYFRSCISYSYITSAAFSARFSGAGFIFDVAGSSIIPETGQEMLFLAFLCSCLTPIFANAQNPTLNLQIGDTAIP
jgi:hypothetical protein